MSLLESIFLFLYMVYGSLLSTFPLGLLVGCAFLFAFRIFIEKKGMGASGIGGGYILESLGTIIGGVILTFSNKSDLLY